MPQAWGSRPAYLMCQDWGEHGASECTGEGPLTQTGPPPRPGAHSQGLAKATSHKSLGNKVCSDL